MTFPTIENLGQYTKLSWGNHFYTIVHPSLCTIGKPYVELCDTQLDSQVVMRFWLNGPINDQPYREVNGFKYESCTNEIKNTIVGVLSDTIKYLEDNNLLPTCIAELHARSIIALRF